MRQYYGVIDAGFVIPRIDLVSALQVGVGALVMIFNKRQEAEGSLVLVAARGGFHEFFQPFQARIHQAAQTLFQLTAVAFLFAASEDTRPASRSGQ